MEPEPEPEPDMVFEEVPEDMNAATETADEECLCDDQFELPPDEALAPEAEPETEPQAWTEPEADESVADLSPAQAETPAPTTAAPRRHPFPIRAPVLEPPALDEALAAISGSEMLSLFNYLKSVTLSLPEPALAEFLLSDERIQLEYVIERLSGKTGLRENRQVLAVRNLLAARQARLGNAGGAQPVKLEETLQFLESLVAALPDQGFAVTIKKWLIDIRGRYAKRDTNADA